MSRPAEAIPLVLTYKGPDVDDGSMSIEDIVPVLEGFASAYGKVAAEQGVTVQHRLRIAGVTRSSANILLQVWELVDRTTGPIEKITVLGGAAHFVIKTILAVIRLRRHTKNQPFKDSITGDNAIMVTNSENVSIVVESHVYNIFRQGTIDPDLAKVARPLVTGKIESVEITASPPGEPPITERIEAGEREYFDFAEVTVTRTQETWLVAQLMSLNKPTESGYLLLTDGTRVHYQYVGPNPHILHETFGTYDGPVRLRAVAHMDENLKVVRLEVTEIERLQGNLFPPDHPEGPTDPRRDPRRKRP